MKLFNNFFAKTMKFTFLGIKERIFYISPAEMEVEVSTQCYKELTNWAKEAYMKNITCRQSKIDFSGTPFRWVWNGFNVLNNVSQGQFEFSYSKENQYIRYHVKFWELFVVHLLFSSIPFVAMFPNILYRFLAFIAIWLVFIINVAVTGVFIDKKIKKIIRQTGAVPVE